MNLYALHDRFCFEVYGAEVHVHCGEGKAGQVEHNTSASQPQWVGARLESLLLRPPRRQTLMHAESMLVRLAGESSAAQLRHRRHESRRLFRRFWFRNLAVCLLTSSFFKP